MFLVKIFFLWSFVYASEEKETIFQVSTINALMEGVYDGDVTFSELKKHGNIGIGTVDDLDGEMIALDGKFYQVKTDGIAYMLNSKTETPFAIVTYFDPEFKTSLAREVNCKELNAYLDGLLESKNIFYAIKIEGKFKYIKTRSVPEQKKPYPKLTEAVKNQTVFEFSDVEGAIIGFWCPQYAENVNVPGYHFHFITKDRKKGGHLLECKIENVTIEIDDCNKMILDLPKTSDFNNADLNVSKQQELEKVEK